MKTKALTYAIIAIMTLSGCSIQKQSAKKKTETIEKKDFYTEEFRTITEKFEGEELNTDIIPLSERKRDAFGNLKEFFETKREGNLKKTIRYKKDGNVSVEVKQIDLTRVIEESVKIEDKGTIETETKEKEKEKEEKVSSTIFLWIAIGVLVVFIGLREYQRRRILK